MVEIMRHNITLWTDKRDMTGWATLECDRKNRFLMSTITQKW